jgi:hypothetical protein
MGLAINRIMANSIYKINKGINKPIEFKGLKAQYIWYLGGGLAGLLVLFSVMYITGINSFVCIAVVLISGALLFMYIYKLSNTYGEHGMMKKIARRSIPKTVKCGTRNIFAAFKRKP